MSGGCDEIFVKEKKKKERKRDKPLCHGLSRRRQKRIRFGQRQMAGNGSKSVASGGRHGRVRGVNRLGSKRSFVRLVSGRVRALLVSFPRNDLWAASRPCESTGSRGALCSPAFFLTKEKKKKKKKKKKGTVYRVLSSSPTTRFIE